MKTIKLAVMASSLVVVLSAGSALGEANLSHTTDGSKPANVTAKVNFKVKVPKVMILRVGDWGNTQNTVDWDYAFGITGLADRAATQDDWDKTGTPGATGASGDTGADGSDGALQVAAFANTGSNVTLKATSTDFTATTGGGATQPHLSEISATNSGDITHPTLVDSGDSAAVTLTATNGVVRATDTWTYTYTPTVAPVGGTYDASVVYTLASI